MPDVSDRSRLCLITTLLLLQLIDITGKDQDESMIALHDCNGDVNRAINVLLEGNQDTVSIGFVRWLSTVRSRLWSNQFYLRPTQPAVSVTNLQMTQSLDVYLQQCWERPPETSELTQLGGQPVSSLAEHPTVSCQCCTGDPATLTSNLLVYVFKYVYM